MVSEKTALGQFGCFSRLHFVESKKQVPLVLPLLFFSGKKKLADGGSNGGMCFHAGMWLVGGFLPAFLSSWKHGGLAGGRSNGGHIIKQQNTRLQNSGPTQKISLNT